MHRRTYSEPIWLISRWVTLITFFMMLATLEAIVTVLGLLTPRNAHDNQHTIEATAKVSSTQSPCGAHSSAEVL
jgi:hypothetical protein